MGQISEALENYTCGISNFETSRNYLSISHCALSVDEIVKQWKSGFNDSKEIRLRCYKGYQMEADLKARIKGLFQERYSEGIEVSAFEGLVKGHPDFMFDGFPGDCKNVQIDEHLPVGGVPRKVYYQMQGYMFYLKKPKALVIYESRGTGKIVDFWLHADRRVGLEIDERFNHVVQLIK